MTTQPTNGDTYVSVIVVFRGQSEQDLRNLVHEVDAQHDPTEPIDPKYVSPVDVLSLWLAGDLESTNTDAEVIDAKFVAAPPTETTTTAPTPEAPHE